MLQETVRGQTSRGQTSQGGLYESVKSLARGLIASARTRLQLLALEIAEERAHLGSMLLLGAIALVCALLGLIFAGGFFILLAWDTPYRLWVAGLLPLFFLAASAVLCVVCRNRHKSHGRMFSASLQEMSKDIDQLKNRHSRPAPPR